jgi:hypothetical protein
MPDPELRAVIVLGKDHLKCPYCGIAGLDNFYYVETASTMRELISLTDQLLLIRSHYAVADESTDNPRLGCKSCDKDCALPPDLELEWE